VAEVEKAIAVDNSLSGVCRDCKLESIDIQLSSDEDQPVAIANLVFSVIYYTKEGKPDTII
jgi:hypothetical protein